MPVDSIATKISPSRASAPAIEAAPPAQRKITADKDITEPARPKVDFCMPPPFHSALAGISQIRPACRSLQRFGGPDAR